MLHSLSTAFLRLWKWVRAFWYKNGLLTLSMLSVVTGCLLGFLLRALELTDLVSLAGMVMGVSGMEWGRGASPGASKGPRWAQPQKQRLLPKKTTSGQVSAHGFSFLFIFFFFLTKKVPTNAQAIGQILPPSNGSEED